jgi:hypothetical protein
MNPIRDLQTLMVEVIGMPNPDADRLDAAVAEILKHGHDDLPEGPPSPLGGEARPNLLTTRTEFETRRLAERGQEIVDKRISARNPQAG